MEKNKEKYCKWRGENKLMIYYHDHVFNKRKTNTNELFKWFILEQAQAGLSWQTVLNKESAYDDFFNDYDISKIANFNVEEQIERMQNFNVIKNKLKLKSVIHNAQIIYELEKTTTFYEYLLLMKDMNINDIVKKMKKDGFKFVGYEIIKSFYESVGLISGHDNNCIYNKEYNEKVIY